ncbi:hypothetical protein ACROYT_G019365 [Oculina patagonica]
MFLEKTLHHLRPPQSFWRSLIYSLTDSVLIILVLGAIAALVLGWYHPEICNGIEQTKTAWMEGCGIIGTVVVIILSSALSDFFRDREFYKMQNRIENSRTCTVVRSGKEVTLCCKDIKVGDLCVLKVGAIVPADGVLTQSNELVTNDSILNAGASVVKGDENPLVFAGSYVKEGSGRFLVTAVGKYTQAFKSNVRKPAVSSELDPDDERLTLQGKLNKASAILGLIGIILGILVAFIIMLRFSIQTYSVENKSYDESHWIEFVQAIIIGIVIIIIAEPEGLSLAVTITLSYCIDKMHASKILVRNVDVVEKMGNLSTICCGKTGVLTELSKMTVTEQVVECYMAEGSYSGHPRYYKDKLPTNLVKDLCDAISINTSYSSNITPSGPQCLPKQIGDRTECALLQFVLDLGEYYPFTRKEHPEETFVKVFGFSPERKSMTTVIPDGGYFKIYSKGAPEVILERCTAIVRHDGSVGKYLPEDAVRIGQVIKNMQDTRHLKVMCVACRYIYPSDESQWNNEDAVTSQLTLLGLVGIDTVDEYAEVESRKRVVEARLDDKKFESFGTRDFKRHKTDNSDFVEEICRGIAVNTKYSSRIQDEDVDNLPKHIGDSTDGALLQLVLEMGETYQIWRDEYPEDTLVHKRASPRGVPPSQEYTAVVIHLKDGGGYKLYCKGAPSYVLRRCAQVALPSLYNRAFDKQNTEQQIEDLVKEKQCEVLCLAIKDFPAKNGSNDWDDEETMSGLTFLGFVGIDETVRKQVPDAIWDFHEAGIKACMVTGDNLSAAGSFGSKIGLLSPTPEWPLKELSCYGCDSKVFNSIDQDTFDKWWPNELRILATAGPAERLEFVKRIMGSRSNPSRESNGEVVAVTASGVNDDKVLKSADVGLTMGVSGTDVAKESADIVLQDDDFSSIVEAVKWGRNLYETILKFLQFQFTVTWVAITVVIVGACVTKRSPLSATQLLWVNLIMDSLASFALTRDLPSNDVLKHKPYGRHKPLLSRTLLKNVILHSIYQLTVMFLVMFVFPDFLDMRDGYEESSVCRPTQHKTMLFTTFVFMQLFNEINCRRLQDRNVFYGLLYGKLKDINFVFIVIWVATFGIQIIIVQFFTNAFRVIDMEWDQWMWSLFFGFSELIWAQLVFTIPKVVIPRQIRCCTSGITKDRKGCCEKLALIRGLSKVRKQNQTMYKYGNQNARFFRSGRVSPADETV